MPAAVSSRATRDAAPRRGAPRKAENDWRNLTLRAAFATKEPYAGVALPRPGGRRLRLLASPPLATFVARMASFHPLESHSVKPRRPELPSIPPRGWAGVSLRDALMSGVVLASVVALALHESSSHELSSWIAIGAAVVGGAVGVGLKLFRQG